MTDVKHKEWPHLFLQVMQRHIDDGGGVLFSGETAEIEAKAFALGLENMRDTVVRLGSVYGREFDVSHQPWIIRTGK